MEQPFVIEPGAFNAFADEAALIEQCKAWGLISDKAVKAKAFVYKRGGVSQPCEIVGTVDDFTAVIAFANGQRHLIHPSFLKEMQASTFGQRNSATAGASVADADDVDAPQADVADAAFEDAMADDAADDVARTSGDDGEAAANATQAQLGDDAETRTPAAAAAIAAMNDGQTATTDKPADAQDAASAPGKKEPAKKKSAKLQLPEEKVKLTAIIQEFTSVPNHFTEEDDEVIVYGEVAIVDPPLELGTAWSSYSNTLKKLELEVGDAVSFDAKVVAKKLTKHPVPYKINNPSKIVKG